MKTAIRRILTAAALFLAVGTALTTPCFAESKLTDAQETMLEQCLAPIKAAQSQMSELVELLLHIRNGKVSAKEAVPEVKRLLESIETNQKSFMEIPRPEDDEVAKIVMLYMRWNGGKLSSSTNFMIQLGTELLNKPETDAELIDVLKNCFFAPSLHSLSEYAAEDLAKAEPEIRILKQFSDCARDFIRTLESITNKEEADAAAPKVKQLLEQLTLQEKQVRSLSPKGKSKLHQEIVQTAGYTYGFPLITLELVDAVDTISRKHACYGSAALKAIFDKI